MKTGARSVPRNHRNLRASGRLLGPEHALTLLPFCLSARVAKKKRRTAPSRNAAVYPIASQAHPRGAWRRHGHDRRPCGVQPQASTERARSALTA